MDTVSLKDIGCGLKKVKGLRPWKRNAVFPENGISIIRKNVQTNLLPEQMGDIWNEVLAWHSSDVIQNLKLYVKKPID